jgi:hypothetical protein
MKITRPMTSKSIPAAAILKKLKRRLISRACTDPGFSTDCSRMISRIAFFI